MNKFILKKLRLVLIIIGGLLVSSCASIITKGNLDQAPALKLQNTKKLNILYSAYLKVEFKAYKSITFADNPEFKSMVKNRLDKIPLAIASEYNPKTGSASFYGDNAYENAVNYAAIKFPIKADYLIVFERSIVRNQSNDFQGNLLLGLLHGFSLGFIPYTIRQEFNIKTTVYNTNGTIVQTQDKIDSARIWSWTPFYFFNGFHMFQNPDELFNPVEENVIQHSISDLNL